jgi:hypothetical protein
MRAAASKISCYRKFLIIFCGIVEKTISKVIFANMGGGEGGAKSEKSARSMVIFISSALSTLCPIKLFLFQIYTFSYTQ